MWKHNISYKEDCDIKIKTNRFQTLCGTIKRALKNKTTTKTQLKFYKLMATPTLLYGSETWIPKNQDLNRIQTAKIKFLRAVDSCAR